MASGTRSGAGREDGAATDSGDQFVDANPAPFIPPDNDGTDSWTGNNILWFFTSMEAMALKNETWEYISEEEGIKTVQDLLNWDTTSSETSEGQGWQEGTSVPDKCLKSSKDEDGGVDCAILQGCWSGDHTVIDDVGSSYVLIQRELEVH